MKTMLILRGNHGKFPDEEGKTHNYDKGALHERAAIEYARRKRYKGIVLDVSGDHGGGKNRSRSPQTLMAVKRIHDDDSVAALYGFSGGGYNVWWILRSLQPEDLKRIELIVVLGAPDRPRAEYESSTFKLPGVKWDLVYKTNPPSSAKFVPKGADPHMFGPEWLLGETPDPDKTTPAP
jgi:hypothetical protein